MRKILLHLIPLLITATTGVAQDTIKLKNGDILSGKILKQDSYTVYFKSDSFGSVSLYTRDIAKITVSTEELGEIEVPAEALAPVVEEKPLPAVEAHKPDLAKHPPKENKQWSGQAGLSFAMRESNSLQQKNDGTLQETEESFETYRINGNIAWTGGQNQLRWDLNYRYSKSDLRKYDDLFNVKQNYNYTFKQKTYYTEAKTLFQRDYRRGIEEEFLQTAELGINWFKNSSKFELSTSVGGGYHEYNRVKRDWQQNVLAEYDEAMPKFVLDQNLKWQLVNSLTFIEKYTHLGDLENYHFLFTAGLENKLIQELFLRVEYRLERDTEIAYDGKGYYDRALLTSILYKF
ncbi:hypothetical protein PDESU_00985 [Pontiella desulfatans]|uniref:DUF481 domain-containing protein n=1 Tax=Pontiella desulfatans TaxID=2750659 RepID=A0A6C2TXW1_PONDE|nr:DUF481 domain-containing protein [Pontiella desulfatans]VGO12433.1 hypothetical protein PDESU_00985 [Pontiella desulfatans]